MTTTTLASLAVRAQDPTYALLRILAGALFSVHGMQKVLGWFSPAFAPAIGSQLWVGGLIELACGLLITFGLLTRPAAFLAAGTMGVAYLQFHWKLQFAGNLWLPLANKGELALLYCLVFLYIAARGAGIIALDGVVRPRRRAESPVGVAVPAR